MQIKSDLKTFKKNSEPNKIQKNKKKIGSNIRRTIRFDRKQNWNALSSNISLSYFQK